MVHAFWLDGSGTYVNPCAAVACPSRRLTTPGSTIARMLSTSISRMRFIRARLINTPPRAGIAPPDNPVPAPRAVYGTPSPVHAGTTWLTPSLDNGDNTASG